MLHHLALRTRDVDGLLAFYRRWFGFAIARDQRPRSVWLTIGPAAVLMIERADDDEPSVPAASRELMAFALTPDERLRLRDELAHLNLLEAETEHTLYFRDPDGRRVALSSYPL